MVEVTKQIEKCLNCQSMVSVAGKELEDLSKQITSNEKNIFVQCRNCNAKNFIASKLNDTGPENFYFYRHELD